MTSSRVTEFVDGRDAAQRMRSVADRAGVVETANFLLLAV